MTENPPALIHARNIGVFKDGRWIVRHVDVDIGRGEVVTLIGPNGGGKSTTAKVLLGLIEPTQGEVVRQRDIKIGYVPQRLTIDRFLPISVRRLMTLTGTCPRGEIEAALGQVGISHLADAQVQTLSGGEFQRALLARAILRRPDLLVLDEPVQGVDFSGEIALYKLIGEIRKSLGCGILLISHDLHIVMAETDRVICLNGHVCCAGVPKSVTESPEYVRLFGHLGAQAISLYQHSHDHSHGPHGEIVPLADDTGTPRGDDGGAGADARETSRAQQARE